MRTGGYEDSRTVGQEDMGKGVQDRSIGDWRIEGQDNWRTGGLED